MRNQDAIRDRLLQLRADLKNLAEIGDDSATVVELDQSKVGRLSRMDALRAQAMAKDSASRREATLRNIEAALRRIDNGDYGACQSCDEPIDPRRLEADPMAALCIDCADRLEQ